MENRSGTFLLSGFKCSRTGQRQERQNCSSGSLPAGWGTPEVRASSGTPSRASEKAPLPVLAPGAEVPTPPRSPGNGWKEADVNIYIIARNKKANSSGQDQGKPAYDVHQRSGQ